MKQKWILFLSGVIVGGLVAWGLTPAPLQNVMEKDERLFRFVDQHLRAYGEAKSPEDKIRQADDLYRKAVVLFLVDLGMKIQGLPAEAPASVLPPADDIPSEVLDEGDPVTSGNSKADDEGVSLGNAKDDRSSKRESLKVHQLSFAKKLEPRITKMNGKFSGTFTSKRADRPPTKVRLESNFASVRGRLQGSYSLIYFDSNGKAAFTDGSKGENKSIRLKPNSKLKVWVNGPDKSNILLQVGNGRRLKGTVYSKDGSVLGRIELEKD